MTKDREKNLVCKTKGTSRWSDSYRRMVSGPCECKYPILRKSESGSYKLIYIMATSSATGRALRIRHIKLGEPVPRGWLLIQPCDNLFVTKSSKGCQVFLKQSGTSKFPGCQAVEDQLIAEGLVSNRLFGELANCSPGDVRGKMGRKARGQDVIDEVTSQILDENIWHVMAELEKLAELKKSNVFLESREKFAKDFSKFWAELPKNIKQATNHFYLKNGDQKSLREIAKKLKVAPSTLSERLKEARLRLAKWEEGWIQLKKSPILDLSRFTIIKKGSAQERLTIKRVKYRLSEDLGVGADKT